MSIVLFCRPLNIIALQLLRANGKTLLMNAITSLNSVIAFVLGLLFFLFVFQKQIIGYFLGVATAEFIIALILFYWVFTNYRIILAKVSQSLTIKLIKFGAPLLLTELSYLLLIN